DTHNLRNAPYTKRSITIINPLRRIDQRKIESRSFPLTLKQRPKNVLSRTRITRTLHNDQLVIVQLTSKTPGDMLQKREIGIPIILQRIRNTDDRDIGPWHR